MNFVFLSPAFPDNYYFFCADLKKEGANVLGIGDTPFGELRPALREVLTWYYQVSNLHNQDELRQAMRFFIERFGPIDRLDSLNEYWLEAEAELRTEFSVPGIQASEVKKIRRKSRMKHIFAHAGIQHAKGRIVSNQMEAHELISQVRFPVVVKPDDGMGAEHTYKLSRPDEVEHFFANKPQKDFIMEEFIEGDIVTFDGLTDPHGNIVFCTSHIYGEGVMEAVLADSHISYYSARELPPDLMDAGHRLVKGFEVKERFFHFEFFRRKDGTLCALEVNIRPPGGMTMDMFNFACDIDMYSVWAKMMTHGTAKLDYTRKYHCAYVSRKNRLNYRYQHSEILARLGPMICHHQSLPGVLARAMGDHGYIIRSANEPDIHSAIALIHEPSGQ